MDPLFNTFLAHFATQQALSKPTRVELCRHLAILNLKKKSVLIRENQRHDFAYFVLKGAVRSYYLKDGVEVNTWFALENEMVGSLHNFKDKPSRETMELLEDSTLISIPLKQLKPLMQTNNEVANFVNAILEEYALFLEDKLFFTQLMSGMDKYRTLLEQEPQLFQRIPLTYLASFLGITRETLSRLRAK